MILHFYDLYVRQIDFFVSNLFIEKNIFVDFVVYNDVSVMYRDVKLFVQLIQRVDIERHQQCKFIIFIF